MVDLLPKINTQKKQKQKVSATEPFALIIMFLVMMMGFGIWEFYNLNLATQAAIDVPNVISFQGKLTDENRITVPDAALDMKLAIYDASSGGTCLWSAKNTDSNTATIDCPSELPGGSVAVTPKDGVFFVLLGDTTASQNALPDTIFSGADRWLAVTIGVDAEMTPRVRIASVPYAVAAGSVAADSLDFTEFADGMALDADTSIALDGAEILSIVNGGTGTAFLIDQNTNVLAFNIDSAATTANLATLSGLGLTTGRGLFLAVDDSLTDGTGAALYIDYDDAGNSTTKDLFIIEADSSSGDTDDPVFRVESSGEAFSDVGFTAGEFSTKFYDGLIDRTSGALSLNTTNNQAITTGTGLLTAGGSLTVTKRLTSAAHADGQGFKLPTNASTPTGFGSTVEGDVVYDTTADKIYVYNGSAFAEVGGGVTADSLDFTDFKDGMALDADTTVAFGANTYRFNLDSSGDFIIQDNGTAFATFTDAGTVGLGGVTSPASKLDVGGALTVRDGCHPGWVTGALNIDVCSGISRVQSGTNITPLPLNLNPYGGSVGIGLGASAPSYTLDVTGTIRATSSITSASWTDGVSQIATYGGRTTFRKLSSGVTEFVVSPNVTQNADNAVLKIMGSDYGADTSNHWYMVFDTFGVSGDVNWTGLNDTADNGMLAVSNEGSTTGFRDLIFGVQNASSGGPGGVVEAMRLNAATTPFVDFFEDKVTILQTGNVGIGDTSPAALLTVGSGDLFQVDSSGNVTTTKRVETAAHAANVGLNLPTYGSAPSAVTGTVEGDIVWDTSGDDLYVYDGANFIQMNGGSVAADSLDYDDFIDAMALDADTSVAFGSNTYRYNLTGTGDFVIQDNGTAFATFNDSGLITFVNAGTGIGLTLDQNGNGTALSIDSEGTTVDVITIPAALATTGDIFDIQANALTSGGLINFETSSVFSGNVVDLDLSSGTSTGNVLDINLSGKGSAINVTAATPDGAATALKVTTNGSSTHSHAVDIINSGSYSDATSLYINNTGYYSKSLDILTNVIGGDTILATQTNTHASGSANYDSNMLELARTPAISGSSTISNTGDLLYVRSDSGSTTPYSTNTARVAYFTQNDSSGTGNAVEILNEGTGRTLMLDQNGNAGALYIDSQATTGGPTVEIDAELTTTADIINIDGLGLTSGRGIYVNVDNSLTDGTGAALMLDYESSDASDDIFIIKSDTGSDENVIFRFEAGGEAFADVGFTAGGASTHFYDGSIDSSGAFSFNTTNNQTITTGTGLLTAGGSLTVTKRLTSAAHADGQGFKLPTNAGTPTGFGSTVEGDVVYDTTADKIYVYNGSAFAEVGGSVTADSLDFTEFKDALALDADTTATLGSYNYIVNADSTGGFLVKDGGVNRIQVLDSGVLTLTGGAASIWSTSAGALTIDSAAALNLGSSTATSLVLGNAANTTSATLYTDAFTVSTDGTGDGEVELPNGSIDTNEILDATLTGDDIASSLAGAGLTLTAGSPDVLGLDLLDATDSTGSTSAISGLEFQGAGADELTLLQGCADGQILKWEEDTDTWDCAADSGGSGDITDVGSMTTGAAFADSTADDDWLGLGIAAGRIEFDDQTVDEIIISDAYVGIGTATPQAKLSFGADITAQKLLLYDSGNYRYGFGIQSAELRQFFGSDGHLSIGTVSTADGTTWIERALLSNAGDFQIDGNLTVDGTGTSYVDGSLTLGSSASDNVVFNADVNSHIIPNTDDTYTLGNTNSRWADLFLGPNTLHIGSSANDGNISYYPSSSLLYFQNTTDSTTGVQFVDADGGTPILNIDTTNEYVGIGTSAPQAKLSLGGDAPAQKMLLYESGNARFGFGLAFQEFRQFYDSDSHLSFGTISLADGTTWTERAQLSNAGNLQIDGNLTVDGTGTSYVDGSLTIGLTADVTGTINADATGTAISADGDLVFTGTGDLIDFSEDLSEKILLWGTTYGIGINLGESAGYVADDGSFAWRKGGALSGTQIMTLDAATGKLNLKTGVLDVDGTGISTIAGSLDVALRVDTASHANNVGLNIPDSNGTPSAVTGTAQGDLVWDYANNILYANDAGSGFVAISNPFGAAIDTGEITDATITGDDIASSLAGAGLTLTAGSPDVLDVGAGNGIAVSASSVAVQLLNAVDSAGSTSNNAGLEFGDTGANELALLQGCDDSQILKWEEDTDTWDCAADSAAGVGADSLDFDDFVDAMALDAETAVAFGANNYIFNLDSTGDFVIKDNGTAFATFDDSGLVTFANAGTGTGLTLDQNGNGTALSIDSEGTTVDVITIPAALATTGDIFDIQANALTSGGLINFETSSTSMTGNIIDIDQTGSAASGHVIDIASSGTGSAINIVHAMADGSDPALKVASTNAATNSNTVEIQHDSNYLGSSALYIYNSMYNSGALEIVTNSGGGDAISVTQNRTFATGTSNYNENMLQLSRVPTIDTGATSANTGDLLYVESDASGTAGFNGTNDASIAVFRQSDTNSTGTAVEIINFGGGKGLFIDQNGNAGSLYIDSQATTGGPTLEIDAELTTTTDIINVDALGLTDGRGIYVNVDNSLTDGTGAALMLDYESSDASDDIFIIKSDTGSDENVIFRFEAGGEAFADVGFTAGGASTHFYDGSIDSFGAFSFNTTNNQTITTGTGLFTAGGDASMNGTVLTLDANNAGAGANLRIIANQGSDTDGEIRYNASTNIWEMSNDGGTFAAIATSSGVAADSLNFTDFADAMALDAATAITASTFAYTINADSTGHIQLQDGGTNRIEIADTGELTLTAGAASTWSASAGSLTLSTTAGGAANSLILSSNDTSADAVDINVTGTGGGMDIDITDGGFYLTAGGSVNGDIGITADDDVTINPQGSLLLRSQTDSAYLDTLDGDIIIDANGTNHYVTVEGTLMAVLRNNAQTASVGALGTGQLTISAEQDNTANAVSIVASGATDSGIQLASNGSIILDASGATYGHIDILSDNIIKLQTTTDSTTGVQIMDADGGTPILNIDTTNERVGIGTATPGYSLVVNSGTAGFTFNAANQVIGTTFGNTGNLTLGVTDAGSGNVTGPGVFLGGSTRADASKNAIRFLQGTTEYMRVDGDYSGHTAGNVGIGTTSPGYSLTVSGTGTQLFSVTSANTDNSNIRVFNTSTGGHDWGLFSTGQLHSYGAGKLAIHDVTANRTSMTFDSDGDVGIGTTSPGARLQIDTASIGSGEVRINASGAESSIGYYTSGDDWVAGVGGWSNANDFAIGSIATSPGVKLLIQTNGYVGIGGDTTPDGLLSVGSTSQFQVDTNGIVSIAASGAAFLKGGDDTQLWDINVAHTLGVYSATDTTQGAIRFGSSGGTIGGASNSVTVAADDDISITAGTASGDQVYISGYTVRLNSDSTSVMVDLQSTTSRTWAVCHSGLAAAYDDVYLQDCTGTPAADYTEMYSVATDVTTGYLVAPGSTDVTTTEGDTFKQLVKTSGAYQATVIGIASDPVDSGDFNTVGYNIAEADNPYPIALVGRVMTKVNDENGPIAAGDPITSSSTPGIGMKSTAPGMVVGYALGDYAASGEGEVMVYVQPGWNSGTAISYDGIGMVFSETTILNSLGTADAVNTAYDSETLSLRGSAWNGTAAENVEMKLVTDVSSTSDYHLSIKNTSDAEVAYVTQDGTMAVSGDMIVTGKLYPSDQGVKQTDFYIYFDSSLGAGLEYMRTNAAGWSTGSYDFAEMFPSNDSLEAGDLVVFASESEHVRRSTQANDTMVAGIVSTRPGFLAGDANPNDFPIALAGRVPTKVSLENGPIAVGDPLTTSSNPGTAMKATQPGMVVGYALEPFDGSQGDNLVITFVNVGYFGGATTDALAGTDNAASQVSVAGGNLSTLDMDGDIYMHGNRIVDVGELRGMAGSWSVNGEGLFTTEGAYDVAIESYTGETVTTHSMLTMYNTITLSGSGQLENGSATIVYDDVNPAFNDVTSTVAPVRVFVTLRENANGLYVSEATNDHFTVQETQNGASDAAFDWYVEAYRKDMEPAEALVIEEEAACDAAHLSACDTLDECKQIPNYYWDGECHINDPELGMVDPSEQTPEDPVVEEPVVEEPVVEPPAEEPVVEEPVVEEPVVEEPVVEEPVVEEPVVEPPVEEPATETPAETPTEPAADAPVADAGTTETAGA